MPVHKLDIEEFLLESNGKPVLDVRSPKEYDKAHIPGAVSLPLFDDEERAAIGTLYKQEGREKAVRAGLDFFSGRMKEIELQAMQAFSGMEGREEPVFYIHCWRGGMRSGAVAWLLGLFGYKVFVLADGYKAFRRWVLAQFEKEVSLKILGGYTGSGKTEILDELRKQNHRVIDLEGIANHKGSAFGSLGMPAQPTQEMFENLLAVELWKNRQMASEEEIWMEDESRHIGKLFIPNPLWDQMRKSPVYFLDIPLQERLSHILKGYGEFDKELLMGCVRKITKRLGGLNTKNALKFIEENNIRSAFEILLEYYDKMYEHSLILHKENGIELHKVRAPNVDIGNAFHLVASISEVSK